MAFNIGEITPERLRLQDRYEELKRIRMGIESMLCDVQKFVRPNGTSFSQGSSVGFGGAQEDGSKLLYDHTAVWANQMFANGLSSYLIPKADRWAYFKPLGIPSAELTDEQLFYLETVSDLVYHYYALPETQFYQAGHENFHDQGSYGTAVTYVRKTDTGVNFRSCPLSDCFFDIDQNGDVDTMFYRRKMRAKQVVQMFPHASNMDDFDFKNSNKEYEIIFAVEPNRDIRARKGGKIGNERPYRTTYWAPQLKQLLQVGALDYFPFLVPRWSVISGEVWGRSPAMTCLSNIRMINKMKKELIKSAEIANAPPLTAEEDSILLPMRYGTRQMIWRTMGSEAPQPIVSGSQPQLTLEMMKSEQEAITRAFFVDQIIREQKKERQSVMEVQDERGQMLQQLGPQLSRQESEFITPAIEITFDILQKKKRLPPAPASMEGMDLELVYTSPAAYAQYSSKISDISGFLQDMTPLFQTDPSLMEGIDSQELMDAYSRYRNVPRRIIKSKQDMAAVKEQRAETEQQQQMMNQAPQLAGAMKDVASARATDPEGIGQLLNAQ